MMNWLALIVGMWMPLLDIVVAIGLVCALVLHCHQPRAVEHEEEERWA
jgi:hypothetical protein